MPTPTDRTRGRRLRERLHYDTERLHDALDAALVCHVAYDVDGSPNVLPMLHVRDGDALLLHTSSGSTLSLLARDGGVDVAVAATTIDGLVYARSGFHHSANYRSAVVHGRAQLVEDRAVKERLLGLLVDRFSPGRNAQLRPPTDQELAATAVLRVPLDEASVKVRAAGVNDDPDDLDAPVWAGVVPLRVTAGVPQQAPDQTTRPPLPTPPHMLRGGA